MGGAEWWDGGVGALRFRVPVLGHMLRHVPVRHVSFSEQCAPFGSALRLGHQNSVRHSIKHVLVKHVPEHVLGHMLEHVLRHVPTTYHLLPTKGSAYCCCPPPSLRHPWATK